ncbi:receptor kinase-like protein Xa21 [Syzygium oleosum]|uniref:receptor kinase-like protein Xa21 n=1 Tax=Syzygium oleosum TaxID=219896 RepID=UPI0024B8B071|nr:receptor kinase-like protein Xa21 [Syzygium oleosum]
MVLEDNPLRGSIPESIRNFSSSLQILLACNCQIRGRIPEEIGFLQRLTFLGLCNNDLDGTIPSSIGGPKSLQRLYLDNNHLEGPIPDDICNLTSLGELLLQQNRMSGSIPNCIGRLSSLQKFLVSSNNMSSVIPVSLWSLQELIILDLSLNSFNGGLPFDMAKIRAITSIDLSWNRLTGAISSSIHKLNSLASLNLSRNSFQGSIPQLIGNLKGLNFLDISYNELSGTIPESMEGLTYLQNLNLSFNKLSGEIPNGGPFGNFSTLSFIGNEALCGNAAFQVPSCKLNGKKSSRDKPLQLLLIMLPIVSTVLLVLVICLLRMCGDTSKKAPVSVENLLGIDHMMISYQELRSATNNFSESNLLGVGSFSSVYKGTLASGTDVAIKVLNLYIEGALKSFDAECEVFRIIRHRNLVKVISTCTNADLRVLVLQYMPHGSLDKWIYSNNYNLGLHQRVKIIVDVATAIEYLHHGQPEPVVHCDMKPSNVLLNEDLVAQVCNFGIAKILAENKPELLARLVTLLRKEKRSIANVLIPQTMTLVEYGLEGKVSTKGDVYSFGILLLEVITGKKPTGEIFDADMSLRRWVGAAIPDRVLDIVDSGILSMKLEDLTLPELESIVLSILELGLECSKDLPEERMDMKTIMGSLALGEAERLNEDDVSGALSVALSAPALVFAPSVQSEHQQLGFQSCVQDSAPSLLPSDTTLLNPRPTSRVEVSNQSLETLLRVRSSSFALILHWTLDLPSCLFFPLLHQRDAEVEGLRERAALRDVSNERDTLKVECVGLVEKAGLLKEGLSEMEKVRRYLEGSFERLKLQNEKLVREKEEGERAIEAAMNKKQEKKKKEEETENRFESNQAKSVFRFSSSEFRFGSRGHP